MSPTGRPAIRSSSVAAAKACGHPTTWGITQPICVQGKEHDAKNISDKTSLTTTLVREKKKAQISLNTATLSVAQSDSVSIRFSCSSTSWRLKVVILSRILFFLPTLTI
jgi:hypothetical protein